MPAVPIIAILANFVLILNVEPGALVFGLVAEVIGVAIWFGFIGATSVETIERQTPTTT